MAGIINFNVSSSSDSDDGGGDVTWNWKRVLRSQPAIIDSIMTSDEDGSFLVKIVESSSQDHENDTSEDLSVHDIEVGEVDEPDSSVDFLEGSTFEIAPSDLEEQGTPSDQSEILFPSPECGYGTQKMCFVNETISHPPTPANLSFMDSLYFSADSESENSSPGTRSTFQCAPPQVKRVPTLNQDFEDMLIAGLNAVNLSTLQKDPTEKELEKDGASAICSAYETVEFPEDNQNADSSRIHEEFVNHCRYLFEECVADCNNNILSEPELRPMSVEVYLEQDVETLHECEEGFPDLKFNYPPVLESLANDYASSNESSFREDEVSPAHSLRLQQAMEKVVASEFDKVKVSSLNFPTDGNGNPFQSIPPANIVPTADAAFVKNLDNISLETLLVQVTVPFSASPGVKSLATGNKETSDDTFFTTDSEEEETRKVINKIGVPFEVPDDNSILEPSVLPKKRTRTRTRGKPKPIKQVDICKDEDDLAEITNPMNKLALGSSKISKSKKSAGSKEILGTSENNARAYDPLTVKHEDFYGDVLLTVDKMAETIEKMPLPGNALQTTILPMDFIPLYDHQQYGLQWLRWRETEFPGGGILADEMGLGKTIMIIALIMKSKEDDLERQENMRNDVEAPRNCIPSKSTLVCCPLGCLHQWNEELESKRTGLTTLIFHGKTKIPSATELSKLDVVLTTYETILGEVSNTSKQPFKNSPLKRVYWKRIVLDEAHTVRNPKSKTSLAIDELKAIHRWAVTGTPIHNKPEDLFSIVKFLKMKPFDEPKVWKHWIGMKNVKPGTTAEHRFYTLGKALILRRTKEEVMQIGGNVGRILPKSVEVVEVELKRDEREVYDHLLQFCRSIFAEFMKSRKERVRELGITGTKSLTEELESFVEINSGIPNKIKFADVLTMLMRLRQCAILPHLLYTMLEDEDEDGMDIVNDSNVLPFISKKNPVFSREYKSSKFEKILEDLEGLRETAKAESRPMDKVVIVSCWTSTLKILCEHCLERKFSCLFITGKESRLERVANQKKFNSFANKYQICLLSLKAGGLGLNLIGGNHVFLVDPHWNPQLELQAQDRLHRFGQTKPVFVRRYIAKDTVEDNILETQEGKRDMAEGLLVGAKVTANGQLSISDLKHLFK